MYIITNIFRISVLNFDPSSNINLFVNSKTFAVRSLWPAIKSTEVLFKISLVNRFNEFRVTSCNYISCIRVSGYIVAREKVLNHRFLVFHPSPPFFSSRLIVTEYTLQTRVSYPLLFVYIFSRFVLS